MKRHTACILTLTAVLFLSACGEADAESGLFYEASGIRPDTVLLSVDGREVTARRYLYWLACACDYIAGYYDSGDGIQWGDTVDGQTLEEYARDQALESAALYATVENWAEDYGCTLTDEDRTAMDREWAARAAQYGGENCENIERGDPQNMVTICPGVIMDSYEKCVELLEERGLV